MFQPQVERWDGNVVEFRAAVQVNPSGSKQEAFGVIWASAHTTVDRVSRMVGFDELKLLRSNFPSLSDNGAGLVADLGTFFVTNPARPMSLDRLQASLVAAQAQTPSGVPVRTDPPQIIVSTSPALLVMIDGAPVVKPVSETGLERVLNTRALILRSGSTFYLHAYDGWLQAATLEGPWTRARAPRGADALAAKLAQTGVTDLLDGGPNAQPKPTLDKEVPVIYVSQSPAELIVFSGQPAFSPLADTGLLRASNTTADVLVDTTDNRYYSLISGRWYRAAAMSGPWSYVANDALPASFARILADSPAGAVLASVAGTPQAQEAVIANSIPQTASVPLKNGPRFTPTFDGPPQYRAIDGTTLSYVVNAPMPIVRVDATSFYAVQSGVWFTAPSVTGPWIVAKAVPPAIYSIPLSSPVHYVTYVRIYGATPTVVYVGYTPGYTGTVVATSGVVVYGTGYTYAPWVGTVYYPVPVTYGVAAQPIYNPAVGFAFGFAVGVALANPYYHWGTPYYHPAYWGTPCCGTVARSANVYGQWGNTVYSGTRSVYANSAGTVGRTAAGSYTNTRTGTSGNYQAQRSYNPYTGQASQGYQRSINTPSGATGNVARGERYDASTGVHSYGSSASVTGAGGSSIDRNVAAASGPGGSARASSTTLTNARTGQTNTVGTATINNDHYATANGNVYRNTGSGWEQHQSGSGWSPAQQPDQSANREAQARSSAQSRASSYSGQGGARAGGNWGGGQARSGGGGGRRR